MSVEDAVVRLYQTIVNDDAVRAGIFIICVTAYVYMVLQKQTVPDQYSSMLNILIGYYFGRATARITLNNKGE